VIDMDGYERPGDWAQDMIRATAALWSPSPEPPTTPAPRSWYRAPTPNPFDLSAWGVPMPRQPFADYGAASWFSPWGAFGSPFGMAGAGSAFQIPWSTIASVASVMAVVQPSAAAGWSPGLPSCYEPAPSPTAGWEALLWPLAQLNALAAVATVSTAFSSYRSDSGHAVAHIVHAPEAGPVASPPAVTIFGWPGFTLH
jgi:hypothetical protein